MLARKLQFTTIFLVLAAILWFFYFWPSAPSWAVLGSLVMLFSFVPVLALQFLAARHINRQHFESPLASKAELIRAWWRETLFALLIFCWRLAFRSNQVADSVDSAHLQAGLRGVVFIHGFICNRGIWTPWLRHLLLLRRGFVAVNLEPVLASIDAYSTIVEDAVQKVTRATGLPPLLICHSMGGLAARAWLQSAPGNDARVHHVVTIGTPHHGTWIGLNRVPPNMKQMKLGSDWLLQLGGSEPPERYRLFTCFYSNCDNIVFPTLSATLPGADNQHVPGDPHVAMVFNQSVMNASLAKL